MFYYYGRKKQLARRYKDPQYDVIVEPFAGSAAYSLYGDRWKKRVILYEKDPKVAEIWEWLINEATDVSILNLPLLKKGEKSSEFLHIIHAATKMAFKYKTIKTTEVLARNWEISRRLMSQNIFKVKHWEIHCSDYSDAQNIEATWFIDPPYKGSAGEGYQYGSSLIDYASLSSWALSRRGQVIFCEGSEGNYLPFQALCSSKGVAGKSSKEFVFYDGFKSEEEAQLALFECA